MRIAGVKPQIENELKKKATKREKWNDSHKDLNYLVALDIQQNWFFEDRLISLLFGEQCTYLHKLFGQPGEPNFPKYSELDIVTLAKENGWKYFLENVGFDPKSNAHIREPGIFINSTIFKNVTGVITRMQDRLQVIPNPFADMQINSPNLEQIIPWRTVEDIYNQRLGISGSDYLNYLKCN